MLCTIMADECNASKCETVPSTEFNSRCVTHNPGKIVVVVLVLNDKPSAWSEGCGQKEPDLKILTGDLDFIKFTMLEFN